ncbi:hypothetical protein AB4254_09095 [Vibrio breoganii]
MKNAALAPFAIVQHNSLPGFIKSIRSGKADVITQDINGGFTTFEKVNLKELEAMPETYAPMPLLRVRTSHSSKKKMSVDDKVRVKHPKTQAILYGCITQKTGSMVKIKLIDHKIINAPTSNVWLVTSDAELKQFHNPLKEWRIEEKQSSTLETKFLIHKEHESFSVFTNHSKLESSNTERFEELKELLPEWLQYSKITHNNTTPSIAKLLTMWHNWLHTA